MDFCKLESARHVPNCTAVIKDKANERMDSSQTSSFQRASRCRYDEPKRYSLSHRYVKRPRTWVKRSDRNWILTQALGKSSSLKKHECPENQMTE